MSRLILLLYIYIYIYNFQLVAPRRRRSAGLTPHAAVPRSNGCGAYFLWIHVWKSKPVVASLGALTAVSECKPVPRIWIFRCCAVNQRWAALAMMPLLTFLLIFYSNGQIQAGAWLQLLRLMVHRLNMDANEPYVKGFLLPYWLIQRTRTSSLNTKAAPPAAGEVNLVRSRLLTSVSHQMQTTWLTDRDMIICMAYLWGRARERKSSSKTDLFLARKIKEYCGTNTHMRFIGKIND